jgi:hypothetical protein
MLLTENILRFHYKGQHSASHESYMLLPRIGWLTLEPLMKRTAYFLTSYIPDGFLLNRSRMGQVNVEHHTKQTG